MAASSDTASVIADDEFTVDPTRPTYDMKKEELEKSIAKLISPWTYIRHHDGEKACFEPVTFAKLREMHADQHFWEPKFAEVDGEQVSLGYVKRPFIPKWITDDRIRTFRRIVSDPTNVDPTLLNLWPGFAAESTPLSERVPDAEVEAYVQPIVQHVRTLLGNDEYADFFLQFMAHLVQRPVTKTELAIVLSGDQGSGKNTIVDFFAKSVLGPKLSVESSRIASLLPEHGHSMLLLNRTLCVVNEVNFTSASGHIDDLKQAITAETLIFNPKCQKEFAAANNVNFIFTTNHQHPLPVSTDNRRLVPFRCSSALVGDFTYFTKLHAFLASPKSAWAFLQYLRNHVQLPEKLSHVMPITDYCKDLQYAGIPWIAKFLTMQCIWAQSGEPELMQRTLQYSTGRGVKSAIWANDYKTWLNEVNPDIGRTLNVGRYGKQVYALLGVSEAQLCAGAAGSLSSTTGILRTRMGGPSHYKVDFGILEQYLRAKRLYDAHLEL